MPKLINYREPRHDYTDDERMDQYNYGQGAPFFFNPRGLLVHRVRSVFQLEWNDPGVYFYGEPWWIVEYWCENSGRTDKHDNGLIWTPGDKLVCARCEANAVKAREKTSDQIVGRHVHIGALRPHRLCCTNEQN